LDNGGPIEQKNPRSVLHFWLKLALPTSFLFKKHYLSQFKDKNFLKDIFIEDMRDKFYQNVPTHSELLTHL
jgi:hypothetical protein